MESNINILLDKIMSLHAIKNDAGLAGFLEVAPPLISKLRHNKLQLGATMIITIHEKTDIPVRDIKQMAA
jgi:plasmid maintenance system antidote protein VapI